MIIRCVMTFENETLACVSLDQGGEMKWGEWSERFP